MIYHYCSKEIFKKIVDSKVLFLTSAEDMKDREEVDFAIQLYDELFAENTIRNLCIITRIQRRDIITILDKALKESIIINAKTSIPYVACFDTKYYNEYLWEKYADKKKGFTLGFDEKFWDFKERPASRNSDISKSITIQKIKYSNENILQEILEEIVIPVLLCDANPMDKKIILLYSLYIYTSSIKRKSFKEECEKRVLYTPNESHDYNNGFIVELEQYEGLNSRKMERRFALKWNDSEKSALKEIVIGKNNDIDDKELMEIITNSNLDVNKINFSRI